MQAKVAQGYKRIEWTCVRNVLHIPAILFSLLTFAPQGCGVSLYADFSEDNPENIQQMTEILQHANDRNIENVAGSHGMQPILGQPNYVPPSSSNQSSISPSSSQSQSSISSNSSMTSSSSLAVSHAGSYLEVCINTGEYTKTLSEIDLRNIECDGQLFQTMRREYSRLRGFRSKFWLLQPSRVDFVRVNMQNPINNSLLIIWHFSSQSNIRSS